ncbi:hypothetical protein RJO15_26330 [Herbaspirillum huttiense F1]|nr:hypothetical protein [Herbaspirillum huttiense]MDT0359329.1 hypothetical protein [Herbaspirillum huttiense F1]
MIDVEVIGGNNAPVLHCDICGEHIREASKAAVVFDNFRNDG